MTVDSNPGRTVLRPPIVLGAALGLLGVALVLVLSRSPLMVTKTNQVAVQTYLKAGRGRSEICQEDEVLPAGTSAIQLFIVAVVGPRLTVAAKSGGRTVSHGTRAQGWTGESVSVPIDRVSSTFRQVDVCVSLGDGAEPIELVGASAPLATGVIVRGTRRPARMRIEYIRLAGGSWWSRFASVSRRIAIGHAWSGSWIALLLIALMMGVLCLACRLLLRELR